MSGRRTAMHWREPRVVLTTSARQGMPSVQIIPMEKEERMTKGKWCGYELLKLQAMLGASGRQLDHSVGSRLGN